MTCIEARAALVEADPQELHGAADTPLAEHLRDCADCRAAAERIVLVENAMGRRLAALAPRRGLARARATPPPKRRPWRWAVPLAAAAGVGALLLLVPRPPESRPAADSRPSTLVREAGGVSVRAPAGRNVAVFETADSGIVVIWFF